MASILFDFSESHSVATWQPINDAVMGGVSSSHLHHDPAGHAVFSGHISFENGGGFASVRCQPGDFGRKDGKAYVLHVLGDGNIYKLNLRTDNAFDGINYQARFTPTADAWGTCRCTLADFVPTWRGRLVRESPPLDFAHVRQIGLMIADRQGGSFALAIQSIAVEIA